MGNQEVRSQPKEKLIALEALAATALLLLGLFTQEKAIAALALVPYGHAALQILSSKK